MAIFELLLISINYYLRIIDDQQFNKYNISFTSNIWSYFNKRNKQKNKINNNPLSPFDSNKNDEIYKENNRFMATHNASSK